MKMSVLAKALLVYFGSLFYFAEGAFVDFTSTEPNHLTLECVSSVTGDVDRQADIFLFSPNGDRDEPTGRVFSGGIFDVNPMNEAFLRCTSGDEQSEFVAIAAVPTISADVTITVDVFDGGTTELTCPFPLGALANHLDPYTFSWETINIQGFSIPVLPSPSSQYSNNNRTLTISVNGSTRDNFYRCVLRLRRCDITRSDGSFRCLAMTYAGPLNRFAVLERSRVITPPNNQEVRLDEVARFVCVGVGSFITISWQYDTNRVSEDAVTVMEDVSGDARQRQIVSTLMIDAAMIDISMLQLQPTVLEYNTDVQCILNQIVPNLVGRNLTFIARLTINIENGGPVGPPPTTPDVQHDNTGGTISLIWTQPQDDVVDSYIITLRRTFNDCPEVDDQNIEVILIGSNRAFNLSGVEESSVYTISIIARNRAGDSTPKDIIITTSIVNPSSSPTNLQVSSTSHTSIIFTWDRVPCVDRNVDITHYGGIIAPRKSTSSESIDTFTVANTGNRMYSAINLIPRTDYLIRVEASHIRANEVIFTSPPTVVFSRTKVSPDIGFFLNGTLYPNNSEVVLTKIGEGYAALYCLTNLTTCCSESEGSMTGEWFLPGQTQPVIGDDAEGADSADFVTSRAASAVLLNRKVNGSQTGTFTCWIPDESGENRTASIRVTGSLRGGNVTVGYTVGSVLSAAALLLIVIIVVIICFIIRKQNRHKLQTNSYSTAIPLYEEIPEPIYEVIHAETEHTAKGLSLSDTTADDKEHEHDQDCDGDFMGEVSHTDVHHYGQVKIFDISPSSASHPASDSEGYYESVHLAAGKMAGAKVTEQLMPNVNVIQLLADAGIHERPQAYDQVPNVNAAQLSDAGVYERAQTYERVPNVNIAQILSQDTCTNGGNCCHGDDANSDQMSVYERVQYGEMTMQLIRGVMQPYEQISGYERVHYSETMERIWRTIYGEESVEPYERVRYSKKAIQLLRRMPPHAVIIADTDRRVPYGENMQWSFEGTSTEETQYNSVQ